MASILTGLKKTPQPVDGTPTETSKAQIETEKVITELFDQVQGGSRSAVLNRNTHLNWLVRLLIQGYPARYIAQDASQPWLMYYVLHGFQLLGVAFDPDTKKKAIATILAKQHPAGGFGGGPGQFPHLLATYPAVCCLAIVGSPGPEGGWDQIDRQGMYKFFMSLKQPDGSFIVSQNGEVDVRGTYALLVVATLLDLLTPELVRGSYEFIRSCQTYEGGFAASSQPYFSPAPDFKILQEPRPYLGEAHGGYTSCAVASLVLLRPFTRPSESSINVQLLLRWAAMMQGTEITEGGGFRGRTNKLVDGCYSWWVGGLFPLIEELLGEFAGESATAISTDNLPSQGADEGDWSDVDDSLLDRKALQRYVLIIAQSDSGGLRDKPSTNADAYHTLYNLAGLASTQHRVFSSRKRIEEIRGKWVEDDGFIPEGHAIPGHADEGWRAMRREAFVAALSWSEDEGASRYVGGAGNRVNAAHPLFNLTMTSTRGIMEHFYRQKTV